jgi:hypothetical protein
MGLALLAANVLAPRRRSTANKSRFAALVGVACFGFAHLVTAYKLEYPWDGIDVLLFMTFGYVAARGGSLLALAPLLLLGAFNHETILYVPLWYALPPSSKKQRGMAIAAAALLGGTIWLLRHLFYRGRPDLPGQVFEEVTPILSNHLHVQHNLQQLFVSNWGEGRAHLSVAILAAIALFTWQLARAATRRGAIWSLGVIASIVAFGYTNETRHYLPLLAFWFAYAWPTAQNGPVSSTTTGR